MRPSDIALAQDIEQKIRSFSSHALPGIAAPEKLDCLVKQIVDSVRRIKYVHTILGKQISDSASDSSIPSFDPLKAAVWHIRQGNIDEAYWLVFLSVYFGKNKKTGWKLLRAVYSGLGETDAWTWEKTTSNPEAFCSWFAANILPIKNEGKFGNHRKYESLSTSGTCEAVMTYINWVGPTHSHETHISEAEKEAGNNPRVLFNFLYKSMSKVHRFGRMGKFDYLTMIGKLGLVNIEPDSTYVHEATGPKDGARLLFGGNKNAPLKFNQLSSALLDLERHLGLHFGMQILEDAICNWQKNPSEYEHFSG